MFVFPSDTLIGGTLTNTYEISSENETPYHCYDSALQRDYDISNSRRHDVYNNDVNG